MKVEHEYNSNSETVNDLIRRARGVEATRARLIEAEFSGFTELSREEIRTEISELRKKLPRGGELQD